MKYYIMWLTESINFPQRIGLMVEKLKKQPCIIFSSFTSEPISFDSYEEAEVFKKETEEIEKENQKYYSKSSILDFRSTYTIVTMDEYNSILYMKDIIE